MRLLTAGCALLADGRVGKPLTWQESGLDMLEKVTGLVGREADSGLRSKEAAAST